MELVGWRAFNESRAGGLRSTSYGYDWRSGVNEARCLALAFSLRHHDPCDTAPGEDCATKFYGARGCGLYAWGNPRVVLARPSLWHSSIVGLVAAWGRVVEHETGFRSQYMTIVALAAHANDTSRPIAKYGAMYDVPVVSLETLGDRGFASEFGETL